MYFNRNGSRHSFIYISKTYIVFDINNDGAVDVAEFLSGLSVLVGGSRDAKIRAAFDLYDLNENGYISLDEFERYLVSVFTVIQESDPSVFEAEDTTPAELAIATANQCFTEADLNHDGRLSFEEFKRWYTNPSGTYANGVSNMEPIANPSLCSS